MRRLQTPTRGTHPIVALILSAVLAAGCGEVEILDPGQQGPEVPVMRPPSVVPVGAGGDDDNPLIKHRDHALLGLEYVPPGSLSALLAGQSGPGASQSQPEGFVPQVITPADKGGKFGTDVVFVDLNCDGHLDMVVGQPSLASDKGRVNIFFGSPNGYGPSPDRVLNGSVTGAMFGFRLAGGVMTNSPAGCGALVVYALKGDGGRGKAYLYLGQKGFNNRVDVGTNGADYMYTLSALSAGANEKLGPGVILVDLDGDGLKDIFFSHHEQKAGSGFARVLGLGSKGGMLRPLGPGETTRPIVISKEADTYIMGGKFDDSFGLVLRNLGRLTSGASESLFIGAYTTGGKQGAYAGRAYILFGATGPQPSPTINIHTSTRVARIDGVPGVTNGFGFDAANVGSFGGSGTWVLFSTPYHSTPNQKHAGKAWLFNAKMLSGVLKATQAPITIINDLPGAAGDLLSRGLASATLCAPGAADLNGDGFDDVTLSAINLGFLGRAVVYTWFGGQNEGELKVSEANLRWIGAGTSFGLRNAYTKINGKAALSISAPYAQDKGLLYLFKSLLTPRFK